MPDRDRPALPPRPRALRVLLTAGRWVLGAALGFGALSFLVHGRAVFTRLGQPDGARIALAGAEILGAALFLFRRTALAGGAVLLIVLAWAAGFHFALDMGSLRLWIYLAAVLVLAAATRAEGVRRPV
jgi:hypothetical protein